MPSLASSAPPPDPPPGGRPLGGGGEGHSGFLFSRRSRVQPTTTTTTTTSSSRGVLYRPKLHSAAPSSSSQLLQAQSSKRKQDRHNEKRQKAAAAILNNRISQAANASKKKHIAFNQPHDEHSRPQEDGKENFMDDEPAPALLLDAASQRALAMEVGRLTQKLDQLHKAHQATVERCEACEEQLLDAQTRRKQLLFDNAKLTRDLTSAQEASKGANDEHAAAISKLQANLHQVELTVAARATQARELVVRVAEAAEAAASASTMMRRSQTETAGAKGDGDGVGGDDAEVEVDVARKCEEVSALAQALGALLGAESNQPNIVVASPAQQQTAPRTGRADERNSEVEHDDDGDEHDDGARASSPSKRKHLLQVIAGLQETKRRLLAKVGTLRVELSKERDATMNSSSYQGVKRECDRLRTRSATLEASVSAAMSDRDASRAAAMTSAAVARKLELELAAEKQRAARREAQLRSWGGEVHASRKDEERARAREEERSAVLAEELASLRAAYGDVEAKLAAAEASKMESQSMTETLRRMLHDRRATAKSALDVLEKVHPDDNLRAYGADEVEVPLTDEGLFTAGGVSPAPAAMKPPASADVQASLHAIAAEVMELEDSLATASRRLDAASSVARDIL